MSALSGAAQLAIVVLSIIWTYRIVKNHRTIGRRTTWGPGMAIGGWFLPPFLYVIPTLVLREAWKAADPAVPPGDDRWKAGKDNPILWAWFLVYGVGTLVLSIIGSSLQFQQFGGDADDLADAYADSLGRDGRPQRRRHRVGRAVGARRAPVDRPPHRAHGRSTR